MSGDRREYYKLYYAANAEVLIVRKLAYYHANKEQIRNQRKRYRAANRDAIKVAEHLKIPIAEARAMIAASGREEDCRRE